jgi:uncharacterized protein YjiS (DUF1127 family)
MSTHNEIKKVTARIVRLVEALIGANDMVRGSYSIVHLRCGKATCWCAKPGQKGHVCTRITWTANGTSRTKTLREEDRERLRKAVETYRMYRRGRRQLRTQEKLLEELLDKHEQAVANNPDKI